MSRTSAASVLAAAIVAVVALSATYPDEVRRYAKDLLGLASSTVASTAAPKAAEQKAPEVPVAVVVTRKIAPSVEFIGHLEASKAVELRPRVGGAINAVSVPEGGLVRPNELLFQLDPRPFQVALDTAKAQLRQARAYLDQAEIDFRRAEALAPDGIVSRKTYDDAQAVRRQRQAQVEIANASVAAAELDLSFTRVTAPIAGRVDRILVTEGNLVTGGNTGAATLLTTIVSIDPLYVYFDIDEAAYLGFVGRQRATNPGWVSGNLPVHVGLMTDSGFPHIGALDFLGNRVDRGTGTIRARAVVRNPDGRLTPGLFARVKMVTAEPAPTVLIDDQAIGTDQGRRYVLVLGPGDKAEYRPVEVGSMIDGLRVISGGLEPTERIIVKGLVRPGMQVIPRTISMLPGRSTEDVGDLARSREARR